MNKRKEILMDKLVSSNKVDELRLSLFYIVEL